MEFRPDKCAKVVLKKRKSVRSVNLVTPDINRETQQTAERGNTYKYLGPEGIEGTDQEMKD